MRMVRLVHTVLCTGDEPVRNDLIRAVGGEMDDYGLMGKDDRRGGALAQLRAMAKELRTSPAFVVLDVPDIIGEKESTGRKRKTRRTHQGLF